MSYPNQEDSVSRHTYLGIRPPQDSWFVFIRSLYTMEYFISLFVFLGVTILTTGYPGFWQLLLGYAAGISSSKVRVLTLCSAQSRLLFEVLFHLEYALLAPVLTHNSHLIAPCSRLHSVRFRAYSVRAGKESRSNLAGRTFTYIVRRVQCLSFP